MKSLARSLMLVLMVCSCSFEEESNPAGRSPQLTKNSNIVGERIDPWTVSTSANDEDDTIDTYFVNRRSGYPSECVVIDANQELLDKMERMLSANGDTYGLLHRIYQNALVDFDILCSAKYHNGQTASNGEKEYRHYQSFYNGTASDKKYRQSYQVTCFNEQNSTRHICRNIIFEAHDKDNNFVIAQNEQSVGSQGLNDQLSELGYYEYLTYDGGKKMLRVPVSDLKPKMREVSPEKSQEIAEYKLMRIKIPLSDRYPPEGWWVQNIDRASYRLAHKIKYPIMYPCNTSASGVTDERRSQGIQPGDPDNDRLVKGFSKTPVCKDLFLNSHTDNCSQELASQEVEVCKLKGRGILVKRGESDILRVVNCEYQPQAKHYYCSGKEPGSNDPPKIYFERYGVLVTMRDLYLPSANCRTFDVHRTDSIGCGQCPVGYDIAEELAKRGCEYNTPHYCEYFSELEKHYSFHTKIERPYRCNLQKTCAFRPTGSRWDNPYCSYTFEQLLKKVPDGDLYSDNGCSIETDNHKCHFKRLSEIK